MAPLHAFLCLILALALQLPTSLAASPTYSLVQDYSGPTFFDDWSYTNGPDINDTLSNVLYQTKEQAIGLNLTVANAAGNAIIRMDNTTVGNFSTYGRPSVYITSSRSISQGNLIILDALHIPFGCSVWPAFWLSGTNWPTNGEIDIIENVNLQTQTRYGLHTLTSNCQHPPANQSSTIETGNLLNPNCFYLANNNEGCVVQEVSQKSFGQPFADNGGGVYALLWDTTGITIWFFERQNVPSDISSGNSPNPSGWPTPSAFYPTSTCDTTQNFGPQNMIFDINVCGAFPISQISSCATGMCSDLVGNPANYNNAYFEIQSLRVFSSAGNSSSSGSGSPTKGAGGSSQTGSPSSAIKYGVDSLWVAATFGLLAWLV